jgi:hypothetical protein
MAVGQSGEQISNNCLAAYLAALGDQNDSGPPEKLFIDHSLPSGKTPLFGGGQRPDDPHRCDAAVRAG